MKPNDIDSRIATYPKDVQLLLKKVRRTIRAPAPDLSSRLTTQTFGQWVTNKPSADPSLGLPAAWDSPEFGCEFEFFAAEKRAMMKHQLTEGEPHSGLANTMR